MPTVGWNQQTWDGQYDWATGGEEWSAWWGGVEAQWFGSLLPRLHAYLPAAEVLEIAPGFGRWSQFLKDWATTRLTLVDLSEACIEHCRARFRSASHLAYYTNDGTSLAMIPDASLDFVFSFDSLVHVEADVIDAYLRQLARKLKPDGVGWIHHSNLQPYQRLFRLRERVRPWLVRERLLKDRLGLWDHHRGASMSAARFAGRCAAVGLQCIGQELVNWGGPMPIDAISTFTPVGSIHARPNRVVTNVGFMREARYIARLAPLYHASGHEPGPDGRAPARRGQARPQPDLNQT